MKRRGRPLRSDRPRVMAVASHPIQYQAPWFCALAQAADIDFSVLFIQRPDAREQGRGFGVAFEWDIPVLEGYAWRMAPDVRGRGGLQGFFATRLGGSTALLRDNDPDVLLLTGWHTWPLVQMLLAGWRQDIPMLMRGDSNALRARPALVEAGHRLLLGRCSAFLTVGKANRDLYRRYGIEDSRLFDSPHFVDNVRFATSAEQALGRRSELRARWSIPVDAMCFCYAGKLEGKKRILDLLAALALAVRGTPRRLHLLVVGTGELSAQAMSMATTESLPVTFTGFLNQSEIPLAYVAADCLVLPSDYGETWGLVVNEAMACGRPAIVSDRVGCGPDLVSEGVTGMTFPFGDIAALADCLVRLAADDAHVSAMGINARTRVMADYSVEKSAGGALQAVRHIMDTL